MTTLNVYWCDGAENRLVGQAHFTRERRQLATTFIYDPGYLRDNGVAIDPALPLVAGAQYQPGMVRAFADSAPDRWGRNLIEKAERARATEEKRSPKQLDDVDFLLGVSDDTRQGALRFRAAEGEDFLGAGSNVPQLVELPRLLRACEQVVSDDHAYDAVKELLDTGSTGLGGARPKAAVRLEDGALGLVKFPHSADRWDVLAWEATALDLLEKNAVRTAQRRLVQVGARSVLVLRRFDRGVGGKRIGYMSALTALGAQDGQQCDYADIAAAVRELSVSVQADLRELFDRVVMSVLLGNSDDHLRNHGFLAEGGLWRLSPAFDVNPNPQATRRATSIMGADTVEQEVEALLPFAQECDLGEEQARERIARACACMAGWREVARGNGVSKRDMKEIGDMLEDRLARLSALA